MQHPVTFEVSGPAVAKGRPRMTGKGVAYTPAKTRAYEAHVRLAAQQAMGARSPFEGPVVVEVTAVLPVPKSWSRKKREDALSGATRPVTRPDVDNYAKAAIDAVNEIVFRDDSQVTELVTRKLYGDRPRLEVKVTPWACGVLFAGRAG